METRKMKREEKERLDALFVRAVTAHRAAMYRAAYALLRSSADAEDAVSAATEGCYRALPRIRAWDGIRAYLIKATVRAGYGILKKRKREAAVDAETALAARQQAEEEETPLWTLTRRLPAPMRVALYLRYEEDMPLAEIARALGTTKGTVSSRLSRTQARLKQWMEQEGC